MPEGTNDEEVKQPKKRKASKYVVLQKREGDGKDGSVVYVVVSSGTTVQKAEDGAKLDGEYVTVLMRRAFKVKQVTAVQRELL